MKDAGVQRKAKAPGHARRQRFRLIESLCLSCEPGGAEQEPPACIAGPPRGTGKRLPASAPAGIRAAPDDRTSRAAPSGADFPRRARSILPFQNETLPAGTNRKAACRSKEAPRRERADRIRRRPGRGRISDQTSTHRTPATGRFGPEVDDKSGRRREITRRRGLPPLPGRPILFRKRIG